MKPQNETATDRGNGRWPKIGELSGKSAQPFFYHTFRPEQERFLRRRYRVDAHRAALIAPLVFGERAP